MPISQDRVIALVAAAEWYRDSFSHARAQIQKLLRRDGTIDTEGLKALFADTFGPAWLEPGQHVEVIIRERTHFKHVGRKNDLQRERKRHARRYEQGFEFEEFPVARRNYPQHIEQPRGTNREPTRATAPDIPHGLNMNHHTPKELEEAEAVRHKQTLLTPQEQAAWAKANGFWSGEATIQMTDERAGQIPNPHNIFGRKATNDQA